jgi:hypothetical protein
LLSAVGLNIREAHVFSTTDGFCLDVFVVDGWDTEVNIDHDRVVLACLLIYFWSMFLFGFLKLTVECSFYGDKTDFELCK